MKTLIVSNGDIQLNNGQMKFASGGNKLVQDLTRWLEEPLGTGYTTPGFGSLLPGMVGQPQTNSSTIQNEVQRVLQLYQGQQALMLQNAQNSAQLSYWNKSEIIQSINSVKVNIQNDTALVSVQLTTLANNKLNINLTINSNGVSVNNG